MDTGDTKRLRVLLAYDGAPYRGFAYQDHRLPTVALSLREALKPLVGFEPELTVAGRTDAGVHAWGQVVSFDIPAATLLRFTPQRLMRSMNKLLSKSITIRDVTVVDDDFSARFSAIGRSYRYTVRTSELPSPFTSHLEWHVGEGLDLDAMNVAAQAIVGEHDFSSFCRRPPAVDGEEVSLGRRVTSALWKPLDEDLIRFDISANAFCHQQVRSLTGMLVAIGKGRRQPEEMGTVLEAKDRQAAVTPAPPQGLCLWEVQYPQID